MKTTCAYYRTLSATNVGADKDSLKRQQDAVRAYAAPHHLQIVHEYYDAAVSGADPVDIRPGFTDMLATCWETALERSSSRRLAGSLVT